QVFDLLAALYESHGFPENAREALQKLVAAQPSHPGVAERLARLDEQLRPSAMVARQVLSNADLHKRQRATLPDLGDLPDLPGGPAPGAAETTMLRSDPELVRRVTGPIPIAVADEVIEELEELPEDALLPATPDSAPAEMFEVGATVAGRYRLEAKIGQGGMAAVFRAFDLELEENVALKVFDMAQSSDVL